MFFISVLPPGLPPGDATPPGREEPQPCTAVTPEPAGTRVALPGGVFLGRGSPPPAAGPWSVVLRT